MNQKILKTLSEVGTLTESELNIHSNLSDLVQKGSLNRGKIDGKVVYTLGKIIKGNEKTLWS